MMTLDKYPELLSKPHLCQIFGISRWTLRDRLRARAYALEWVWDGSGAKATKESVLAHLKKMRLKAARELGVGARLVVNS